MTQKKIQVVNLKSFKENNLFQLSLRHFSLDALQVFVDYKAGSWKELPNATSGLNMMSIASWQSIYAVGPVILAHNVKNSISFSFTELKC